ncbi:MAG: DUF1292 domain-containing protein [Clostridia bacterium]|nr:DUF1292 domain-containing protein [Clostridia bacterium]
MTDVDKVSDAGAVVYDETIELTGPKGEKYNFGFLDHIKYEGADYAVLYSENNGPGRFVVLKVEDVNGDDVADYVSVTDRSVVDAVFEIYKKKLGDAL